MRIPTIKAVRRYRKIALQLELEVAIYHTASVGGIFDFDSQNSTCM